MRGWSCREIRVKERPERAAARTARTNRQRGGRATSAVDQIVAGGSETPVLSVCRELFP